MWKPRISPIENVPAIYMLLACTSMWRCSSHKSSTAAGKGWEPYLSVISALKSFNFQASECKEFQENQCYLLFQFLSNLLVGSIWMVHPLAHWSKNWWSATYFKQTTDKDWWRIKNNWLRGWSEPCCIILQIGVHSCCQPIMCWWGTGIMKFK